MNLIEKIREIEKNREDIELEEFFDDLFMEDSEENIQFQKFLDVSTKVILAIVATLFLIGFPHWIGLV